MPVAWSSTPFPSMPSWNHAPLPKAQRRELWLDNGNVVVVAESDRGDWMWRVDEGATSNGSDLLRRVFASSGAVHSSMHEYTVIRVNEPADEVEDVLEVLYGIQALPDELDDLTSFEEFVDFLKVFAKFGVWSHFFAALRPFYSAYKKRLVLFSKWNGKRDPPLPPYNPVYILNITLAARQLLERYASISAVDEDTETSIALQVIESGARLDLSMFITAEEVEHTPDQNPQVAIGQELNELSTGEKTRNKSLCTLHRDHLHQLHDILHNFEGLTSPPPNHMRCCGTELKALFEQVSTNMTIKPSMYLDVLRALHSDSGRRQICESCRGDLDLILDAAYSRWWKELSPFIRGIVGKFEQS